MMSDYLQLPVVNNFRSNDIEHGGQGAPLAPIYHLALARYTKQKNIVFLNIGGVTNITYVGENDELIAVKSSISKTNQVSYMKDFMGFHSLENISNKKSMSLHLYAKPIRKCTVFDEDSKGFVNKEMSYHTTASTRIKN